MSNNSVNFQNVPGGQAPPKNKSNFYRGRGKYNNNWSKRGHWRGNYRGKVVTVIYIIHKFFMLLKSMKVFFFLKSLFFIFV